ncbi:MAG: EamA family transporter [Pseudomonadota bacterium]
MRISHLFLAIAVVFVWGTNFVVIKWGLAQFPPFLLAALRFALSVFPWIFFIPRPAVGWAPLAKFGVLLGAGQFGLLFLAMRSDISPGLASLLMQSQVFFTIGAALLLKGERLRRLQIPATMLALAGIGLIAWHALGPDGGNSVTATGLVLCLLAAVCWAAANLVVRSVGRVDALAFMVWSSPFSLPPLIAMSLIFEGGPAVAQALMHATWGGWAVVLWQAVGNTLFGFGAWNWLLARYPAATVAPTALLVPVFGMSASAWVLGESLPGWKLAAAALVMAGLAMNLIASRAPAPAKL